MREVIAGVRDAVEKECWIPALALALTLPDICGQIAYPSYKVGKRYKTWFKQNAEHRFLNGKGFDENGCPTAYFTANMCYDLRNEILHAGNDDLEFEYGAKEDCFDYNYEFELRICASNSFGETYFESHDNERVTKDVRVAIDIKTLCDILCEESERFLRDVDESQLKNHRIRIVDVGEFVQRNRLRARKDTHGE